MADSCACFRAQEAAGAGAGDGGNASEYAAAQFALLHERITGKADAEEAAGLQLEVAALKRAVGPALLAQQQDPTETGVSHVSICTAVAFLWLCFEL